MKRFLCAVLIAALVISLCYVIVMAADVEPVISNPVGYSADRIEIADLAQVPDIMTFNFDAIGKSYKIVDANGIKKLSDLVTKEFFLCEEITFYLANDIDMSGVTDFVPIGTSNSLMFGGIFDGQGHTIDNLVIDVPTSATGGTVFLGLFGKTAGATVKNLVIGENSRVNYAGKDTAYCSMLIASAGARDGFNTVIDNCWNRGSVVGHNWAGALIAHCYLSKAAQKLVIKNTTNSGDCVGIKHAGGFIGYSDCNLEISNCVNEGNISIPSAAIDNQHGAAGFVAVCRTVARDYTLDFDTCVNYGKITGGVAAAILGVQTKNKINIKNSLNYGILATPGTVATNLKPWVAFKDNAVANNAAVAADCFDLSDQSMINAMLGTADSVVGYSAKNVVAVNLTDVADFNTFDAASDVRSYKITDVAGLQKLSETVNGGNNLNAFTIYLANNIDLASVENFGMIGNTSKAFAGTFDGQGFRIKNLKIDASADTAATLCVGLFGKTTGATIKNTIIDATGSVSYTGTATYPYIAGFVGNADRLGDVGTTIENCMNEASVSGDGYTAGIVARYFYKATTVPMLTIKNCTNAGAITDNQIAGGILAYCDGKVEISACRNLGNIVMTAEKAVKGNGAGGIIAACNQNGVSQVVTSCINNGNINGAVAAGIVAYSNNDNLKIEKSQNFGFVTSDVTGALLNDILANDAAAVKATPKPATLIDNVNLVVKVPTVWVDPTPDESLITTEPEVTTTEPIVTTPEPIVTTTEPIVTTPEPIVTTTEPVVTTTEPIVTTPEPIVTTTEPVVTNPEHPANTTAEEPSVPTGDEDTTTVPHTDNGKSSCGSVSIIGILIAMIPTGAILFIKKHK